MRCNNCAKTIPDTSKICPYCKNPVDPYARPQEINFGTVTDTDYDEKHENSLTTVNKYLNNPKNKKYVMLGVIMIIIIIIIFGLLIGSIFTSSVSKDKTNLFNNTIEDVVNILKEISISSGHHGEYDLKLKINDINYDISGKYETKVDDKYLYLTGNLEDELEEDDEIIIDSKELDFEVILNKNEIYFKSDQILKDNLINLTINDETGLLKTERYNLDNLIDSSKNSLKKAFSVLEPIESSETIDYRGSNKRVNKLSIEFDNKNKIIFLEKLFTELKNDANFMNEYSKISGNNKAQATKVLDNYNNNYRYRFSGNSSRKTIVSMYYLGSKVYRIEFDINEDIKKRIYVDIGDNKYYFHAFEDSKEIASFTLSYVERENDNTIFRDFELTYDDDNYIIDSSLSLRETKKGRITKQTEFKNAKNIKDLTEEEIKVLKTNIDYYLDEAIYKYIDKYFHNKNEEKLLEEYVNTEE